MRCSGSTAHYFKLKPGVPFHMAVLTCVDALVVEAVLKVLEVSRSRSRSSQRGNFSF